MTEKKCIFTLWTKHFIRAWREKPEVKEKRCVWNVEKEG